tara:strand:+ start:270 stop:440 length:171 start_codon:yes stop_codon:yes gene_type:complete
MRVQKISDEEDEVDTVKEVSEHGLWPAHTVGHNDVFLMATGGHCLHAFGIALMDIA